MRDYQFDSEVLFKFSESSPYSQIPSSHRSLKDYLDKTQRELNFPAIKDDIGQLIRLLIMLNRPKTIFEMGSGFGHSCFWYIVDQLESISQIYLTETRKDLFQYYSQANWPDFSQQKVKYFNEDAFEVLKKVEDKIDFVLKKSESKICFHLGDQFTFFSGSKKVGIFFSRFFRILLRIYK